MSQDAIIGVEDGYFKFQNKGDNRTLLCGVLMINNKIEKILLSKIKVDGMDATDKLLEMINGIENSTIILGGITFAGFNIIDPFKIFEEKHFPIIVYSSRKPSSGKMLDALKKHFTDWASRWSIIQRLGDIHEYSVRPGEPPIYFEIVGETPEYAEKILKKSALVCRIPEPVRVAKIIARGLSIRAL